MRFPFRLVSFLLACAALGGCTRTTGDGLPPELQLEDLPDQESWDATLRVTEGGRPRFVLRAPYVARFERPDTSYTVLRTDPRRPSRERVAVELFEPDGSPGARVASDRLTYFDRDRRFLAEGRVEVELPRGEGTGARVTAGRLTYAEADRRFDVEGAVAVRTGDGRVLEAQRVVWDEGSRQFRAPGAFRFTSPSERIGGRGLVANEALTRYSFSRASGQLEVRE